jgi:hypothetical protein
MCVCIVCVCVCYGRVWVRSVWSVCVLCVCVCVLCVCARARAHLFVAGSEVKGKRIFFHIQFSVGPLNGDYAVEK